MKKFIASVLIAVLLASSLSCFMTIGTLAATLQTNVYVSASG